MKQKQKQILALGSLEIIRVHRHLETNKERILK